MHRILPLILLAGLTACSAHLYDVDGGASNGGVPFYVLEQYDVTTNLYAEVFYKIEVKATLHPTKDAAKGAKKAEPVTVTVVAYNSDSNMVNGMYFDFVKSSDFDKAWAATGELLLGKLHSKAPEVSLVPFDPISTPTDLLKRKVIATSTSRTQIPSPVLHYYNITVPHGGQASGEIGLGADGTLTKALSSKQDTLPGTITTALGTLGAAALGTPLNQLVNHFFPTPVAATAVAAPATANGLHGLDFVNVQMTITPITRLYSVALTHKSDAPALCASWKSGATFESTTTCWATVSVANKEDAEAAGDKKDDNSVTFSGSVKLPAPTKAGTK